jgi:predicted tellurium resistance membrane protein TerC
MLLLAVLVGWSCAGATAPDTNTPVAETPSLRIRATLKTGAAPQEAVLLLATVRLQSDIGILELRTDQILRITFARDGTESSSQDLVQLRDKSILRGQVQVHEFPVRVDTNVQSWSRTELLEIRFLDSRDTSWIALLIGLITLTLMEIVLGIDNVIFLAIVVGKLPPPQQPLARRFGLAAALGMRLLLLLFLSFLMGLTAPLLTLPPLPFLYDWEARVISWRDLILLAGGLFLMGKSVREMHEKLEQASSGSRLATQTRRPTRFLSAVITIALIDIVFSLDSVITAIGMVEDIWVMVTAMVLAMFVMLAFARSISTFVERHPTIKVLALSFLILIGVLLAAEGLGQHLDKGYIYFAMAFAVAVELINLRLRSQEASQLPKDASIPGPNPEQSNT